MKIQHCENVRGEFIDFNEAIRKPRPAIETFSNEALMLIYLIYGEKALRKVKVKPPNNN